MRPKHDVILPPRENPVRMGKHPDLLAQPTTDRPDSDFDTEVVIEDWRLASPADLKRGAVAGTIDDEDLGEMEDYAELADTNGDLDALIADGMSRQLARAVAEGLHEELLELDEKARERRAKPFIEFIRSRATGHPEYEFEPGNDGFNNIVDQFQQSLDETTFARMKKAAAEVFHEHRQTQDGRGGPTDVDLDTIDDETLEAILRDPANWSVQRVGQYGGRPGIVWSWTIGDVEDQGDGTEYDPELKAIVFGGEYEHTRWGPRGDAYNAGERDEAVLAALQGGIGNVEVYPGLSQSDLTYALDELEKHEPYVSFHDRRSRRGSAEAKDMQPKDLRKSFSYNIGMYSDDVMVAVPDEETMSAALAEALNRPAPATGPENDDVVYTYAGTHDSVAGASGRGMYVARLKPSDLRKEGAQQGICIGTENLGHPKALREGRTQVFSIRTESGKPKFTIELKKSIASAFLTPGSLQWAAAQRAEESGGIAGAWAVAEVKGKANRLAGFAANSDKFSKPDDLRLVTDFLLSLGYDPEYLRTVSDIAPGIKAMEESGVDPFVPPPRKKKAEQSPTPNPASRAVAKLLARAKPMGRFR